MRSFFRWIALALCALLFLTCLSPALADFGGFDFDGDYGGYDDGGYDDGGYDDDYGGSDFTGSNSQDGNYGGGNRGGGDSDRRYLGVFFAVIGILGLFVLAVRAIPKIIPKAIGRLRGSVSNLLYKGRMKKLPALTRIDPDFDLEQLRKWVRSLYTRMQAQWGAGDISGVKEEFTKDCWDRFDRQLRRKTAAGHRGHVQDISFLGIDFLGWADDGAKTYLDLALRTRIRSWDTDKSGQVISGSRTDPKVMGYVWRLERPSAARSVSGITCPHCGATTSPLIPRCQKCDEALSRSADAWRLSSIDGQRV